MKNKKAYTLIELLAVIIILGILLLIAVPSITKIQTVVNQRKFDEYQRQFLVLAMNKLKSDPDLEKTVTLNDIGKDKLDDCSFGEVTFKSCDYNNDKNEYTCDFNKGTYSLTCGEKGEYSVNDKSIEDLNFNVTNTEQTNKEASNAGLTARIITQGPIDLKNNKSQKIKIEVKSTYQYNPVEFEIKGSFTEYFSINYIEPNKTPEIKPNTTQDFTFNIKRNDNIIFDNDTINISISIKNLRNKKTTRIGLISATVLSDNEPPVIESITYEKLETAGQVKVTCKANDPSGIRKYYIESWQSNVNGSYFTSGRTITETPNNSLIITIKTDGLGKYVKCYAEDTKGNKTTQLDINSCDNIKYNSLYCKRSNPYYTSWSKITINYLKATLADISSNKATTITSGNTYITTLTYSGGIFGSSSHPSSVIVQMGNKTLTNGTGYTYNSSTGELIITNVTGTLNITVIS